MPGRSRLAAARPWILAALVLVTALAARFSYWAEVRGTALDRWHLWTETDMATYLEQARRIAEEDVLAREPYHPYHAWQRVAPAEKWLEWYGPHAFHQAPAYSYVLAALGPREPETLRAVKAAQLVLGAGTALLVFLLAARVGGLVAGTVGGLVAALYGPLLYLEPQLLREGPAVFGMLAVLYATIRLVESRAGGARLLAATAAVGAACGVYATFHEMGTVLKIAVALALLARHARDGWRRVSATLGLFAAGYVVGFAPLLWRNVAVGADPFAVSCRTAVNFAEANVADAPRGGSIFAPPTPQAIAILDEAQGDFARAALGVWRSYDGDLGKLLANWWKRFGVIWQKWEVPDNTSYYFYRRLTDGLDSLSDFRAVFPPGLAAAALLLAAAATRAIRRRRDTPPPDAAAPHPEHPRGNDLSVSGPAGEAPRLDLRSGESCSSSNPASTAPRPALGRENDSPAPGHATEAPRSELGRGERRSAPGPAADLWRRSPAGHGILLFHLAGLVSALSLVHTVARFRIYVVPFFLIYSGVFAALIVLAIRHRRPLPLLPLVILTATAWHWMDSATPALSRPLPRTFDYQTAIALALLEDDVPEATHYATDARTPFPRDPSFHEQIARHLERRGHRPEAAAHYRQALTINPRIRTLQEALRRVTD